MPLIIKIILLIGFAILFFFGFLPYIIQMYFPTFALFARRRFYEKNENLQSKYESGEFKNENNIKSNLKFTEVFKVLVLMIRRKSSTKPKIRIPVEQLEKDFFDEKSENLEIVWLGHSSVLIKIDKKTILFDPSLSKYASPFWFANRRFCDIPIDLKDNFNIDIVVYSHDHYDHLDYQTFKKIKTKTSKFISPLGVAPILELWGLERYRNIEMDWWQEIEIDGLKIICTPAQHFSGRSMGQRNKSLWASFVVIGKNKKIFFSGDGGYGNHFRQIGFKYGPFDLTMIECGQYNELWKQIHLMPEETAKAHKDLRGKYLLPIHWSAFALSTHKWNEPMDRLENVVGDITILKPKIGEVINL